MSGITYKRDTMCAWNELAGRYHSRWAESGTGPFGCAEMLASLVGIGVGDVVLDAACGTGAATRHIADVVGQDGVVVGVDASSMALHIAAECRMPPNVMYLNADAETMWLAAYFDAVVCQFGVFFFYDAASALRNMAAMTRPGGRLGVVVHGPRDEVPYYGCILDEIVSYIPEYMYQGGPALDRYSDKSALCGLAEEAGYHDIVVKATPYRYSPGNFDEYWNGYVRYITEAQRRKIESLDVYSMGRLLEAVRYRTMPYTREDGTITFPWQVLILAASI